MKQVLFTPGPGLRIAVRKQHTKKLIGGANAWADLLIWYAQTIDRSQTSHLRKLRLNLLCPPCSLLT